MDAIASSSQLSALNAGIPPQSVHRAAVAGDPLEAAAKHLIGQTFFGTLLREAQNSPFHSNLFEGGRGGEAFSTLFNQRLAEHLSNGVGNRLARSVVSHLRKGRQSKKPPRSNPS